MTNPQRLFPWAVVWLATIYLLLQARPPKDNGPFDLQSFGHIPVSADGRVKPLDTVARNGLMVMSDRRSFRIDGKRQPAIRWLADVIARPEAAQEYRVFRIDHPDVLAIMGMTHDDGKRFSLTTMMDHQKAIFQQTQLARQVKPKQRNPYQKHLLELYGHVNLYMRLSQLDRPYVVPPLEQNEQWRPFDQVFQESQQTDQPNLAVAYLSSVLAAYQENKPDLFNQQVTQYLGFLTQRIPAAVRKARYEVLFNNVQPFYHATVLYVIAFVLACVSFLLGCLSRPAWSRSLGRATVWLLLLTLAAHTLGLGFRIYLQGRPPVTNLYSSAVFIGWGCVLLALFLEWLYRMGLGSITAAAIGFITLIIAHNLGGDGDTMEMMQAVLDSNFWLATHVVAVTIGYSATFLAGVLGILFILLGVFTTVLKPELFKSLGKMIYGVVCFAALLSFVGTVLGGIWADQSWGRFWGWDPKENGAVLIVLMNMLILHARWGGVIRERGMAVLAVSGNIVTGWSWFGTNMLGVGLHSYGFMDSAVFWLLTFVGSQLVLMGIGSLPLNLWRSYGRGDSEKSGATA